MKTWKITGFLSFLVLGFLLISGCTASLGGISCSGNNCTIRPGGVSYGACPSGYFKGDDNKCYPNGVVKCNCEDNMYCEAGGECINNVWLTKCPADTFRGVDKKCHPNGNVLCNCGGYTYCQAGGICCNNQWLSPCLTGRHFDYSDCSCH